SSWLKRNRSAHARVTLTEGPTLELEEHAALRGFFDRDLVVRIPAGIDDGPVSDDLQIDSERAVRAELAAQDRRVFRERPEMLGALGLTPFAAPIRDSGQEITHAEF